MKGKKLALALSAAILCSGFLPTVEAAKIDNIRNILLSKTYTIKYDNITPPKRLTNRDKAPLFGNSGMAVDKNDYLTNRPRSGIVVSDGEDRYEEVGDGVFFQCRLIKKDEVFNFTKYPQKDNPKVFEYMGVKKNKVEAVKRNYLAEALSGESYGDSDVTRLILAMLPKDKKVAGDFVYSPAGSGNLANGLSYEDFKGSVGGQTQVIRYYFNGNDLVKIAAAEFYKTPSGNMEGRKCIIKINEFAFAAERNFLKLPAGLKDETKRKGKD